MPRPPFILLPSSFILLLAPFTLAADKSPTSRPTNATAPAAGALIEQIKAIKPPAVDQNRRNDPQYVRAYITQMNAARDKRIALANRLVNQYPDHPDAPDLLLFIAESTSDPKAQLAAFRKIVAKYPDSDAAKEAAGPLRQADAVGKPFELSFTDAISGKPMSMADLKGKVVVIDFWATWCGPCKAEMPHNKELYAKYKDKGVEFIGVSLDQPEDKGGLKALKDYVAANGITWPQYYQGNFWQSDFSRSWGIDSIPRVFIVDKNGNLASTEARGQLDKLIPQLLNKPAPRTH